MSEEDSQEYITCPLCGHTRRMLTKHYKKHHGLSEEDIDRMNLSRIAKASSGRMREGQYY